MPLVAPMCGARKHGGQNLSRKAKKKHGNLLEFDLLSRDEGDNGLFITLVPKF